MRATAAATISSSVGRHARLAFRLPRRLFCSLTILAAATVAFSLWGIQYVYETIHVYG